MKPVDAFPPNPARTGEDSPFAALAEHFLNSVSEACALLDAEGRVIRANLAYRRLTGPAGGAHDASILSFLDPVAREQARDAMAALAHRRAQRTLTWPLRIGRDLRLIEAQLTWSIGLEAFAFVGRDVTEKHALERQRGESSAERTALEQAGGLGHWRASRDFKLRLSPSAARILGLDPNGAALDLTDVLDLVEQENRAFALETARTVDRTRKPFSASLRIRRPDGGLRAVQVVGAPFIDPEGGVEAVHGLVVDKTDTCAALHAALNSEGVLSSFIRSAPVAVAMFDRDMRLLVASDRYLQSMSRTAEHCLGRTFTELVPWAPEKWSLAHRRALRGEQLSEEGDLFELPGRGRRWMRWSCAPWRSADGDIGGVIIMHEDVTGFMRAQREMEASRQRLQIGAAMSTMLIWEVDFETRDCRVEGDWRKFFPEPPTFDLLSSAGAWAHPADRDRISAAWRARLRGGAEEAVDYRVAMPGGREAWQSISFWVVRNDQGDPARVIANVQDITQRKHTERLAREAETKLVAASAARSDFLAGISHELKSPLNAVINVTDMLERTRLDEGQKEMARLIRSAGRMLQMRLDDIVDFARRDGGDASIRAQPFTFEGLIRAAHEAAQVQATAKSGRVSLLKATALDGVFVGDRDRLRQIATHLLTEGVRLAPAGAISVTVGVGEGAAPGAGDLSIRVEETAPVHPRDADQLAALLKVEPAGPEASAFSLGLPLVKRLVDDIGGRLALRVSETGGFLFDVRAPLQRDRIARLGSDLVPAGVEEAEMLPASEVRLLVAEDNATNRRVIELVLAGFVSDITFVADGRAAVNECLAREFDLVLMDLLMPVLNGVRAIEAIRAGEAEGGRRRTPIVVVSANAGEEHRQKALDAGADDLVAKPIDRDRLLSAIARHALRPKGAVQASIDLDKVAPPAFADGLLGLRAS